MSEELEGRIRYRIQNGLIEANENLGCVCVMCVADYLVNEVMDELD